MILPIYLLFYLHYFSLLTFSFTLNISLYSLSPLSTSTCVFFFISTVCSFQCFHLSVCLIYVVCSPSPIYPSFLFSLVFLFTFILLIIPCISEGWRTPRVLFLSPSRHQAVISNSCYPRGLDRCQHVTRGIRLDIVGQVETVKGQEECKMRFYFYSNNMKPSCIKWMKYSNNCNT